MHTDGSNLSGLGPAYQLHQARLYVQIIDLMKIIIMIPCKILKKNKNEKRSEVSNLGAHVCHPCNLADKPSKILCLFRASSWNFPMNLFISPSKKCKHYFFILGITWCRASWLYCSPRDLC